MTRSSENRLALRPRPNSGIIFAVIDFVMVEFVAIERFDQVELANTKERMGSNQGNEKK
jgi:hypothetical protein